LLHSATIYGVEEPGISTGSKGDPVAMSAFPPVQFWAFSGLYVSEAKPCRGIVGAAYVTS
jgi:hypothetical protein